MDDRLSKISKQHDPEYIASCLQHHQDMIYALEKARDELKQHHLTTGVYGYICHLLTKVVK